MYAVQCSEYKAMGIWRDCLCKLCISSCKERKYDYDLAGKRWSLRAGGRTKRPARVGMEGKGKVQLLKFGENAERGE